MATKYAHLQGWSRTFGAKYENVSTKILKPKLTKIKEQCSTEKLAKERLMYVSSNSEAFKFQQRDIISDCEFLLSILNAFTVSTKEYYSKCCNVNDAKCLQNLNHDWGVILRLGVANDKYWLI